MRTVGTVMLIGTKALAGHTHSCANELTLFLEATNHLHQGSEKGDLLRPRESLRCSRQPIRHTGRRPTGPKSFGRQLRRHHTSIARVSLPAHQLFRKLGDLGLLGLTKPERDGGQGLDYSYALVLAEAADRQIAVPVVAAFVSRLVDATHADSTLSPERVKTYTAPAWGIESSS